MRARLRRISRLRLASRRRAAQHLVVTGVLPATLYSAPVRGLLEREVVALQQISAGYLTAPGFGKSRSRSLLLGKDFSAPPVVAPLHLHSVMVWDAARHANSVTPLPQLITDWRSQFDRGFPKKMANTTGPFGVVAVTIARLGWRVTRSPMEFLDENMATISILKLGPAMVRQLATRSWRARIQEQAARSLGLSPLSARTSTVSSSIFVGSSAATASQELPQAGGALKAPGIDSYHLRRLLLLTGPCSDLSQLQVGCALNYLAGGVWTMQRLHDAGYDLGGLSLSCPLCGLHPDTPHNRLFNCSATASIRSSILTRADLITLNDPAFSLEAAGWVARPSLPKESDPQSQCISIGPDFDISSVSGADMHYDDLCQIPWTACFVDGTCTMQAHHPDFRISAWAVVVQSVWGHHFDAAVVGPVFSPVPQTSGAAEIIAFTAAHQIADDSAHVSRQLHTDYLSAVSLPLLPLSSLLQHHRTFAGIFRDLQTYLSFREMQVHKVKAHTGGSTNEEKGNELADLLCKQFANTRFTRTHAARLDHEARSALAAKVALLAARALPLFPTMRHMASQIGRTRFARMQSQPRVRLRPGHAPVQPNRPHIRVPVPGSASQVRCCVCALAFQRSSHASVFPNASASILFCISRLQVIASTLSLLSVNCMRASCSRFAPDAVPPLFALPSRILALLQLFLPAVRPTGSLRSGRAAIRIVSAALEPVCLRLSFLRTCRHRCSHTPHEPPATHVLFLLKLSTSVSVFAFVALHLHLCLRLPLLLLCRRCCRRRCRFCFCCLLLLAPAQHQHPIYPR